MSCTPHPLATLLVPIFVHSRYTSCGTLLVHFWYAFLPFTTLLWLHSDYTFAAPPLVHSCYAFWYTLTTLLLHILCYHSCHAFWYTLGTLLLHLPWYTLATHFCTPLLRHCYTFGTHSLYAVGAPPLVHPWYTLATLPSIRSRHAPTTEQEKKGKQKTTTPRIPTWSPTMALTGRHPA